MKMGFHKTIVGARVVLTVQNDEGTFEDVERLPPLEDGYAADYLEQTWEELYSMPTATVMKGGLILISCMMVVTKDGKMALKVASNTGH